MLNEDNLEQEEKLLSEFVECKIKMTKGDILQYLERVDIDTPIEQINFDNELVVCLDEVLADYFSAYTIEGKTKQINNI